MKYDELKTIFDQALGQAQHLGFSPESREVINLGNMSRTYLVYLGSHALQEAEPFHVSCKLSWIWDALQTARTLTTEEDVLTELLGREDAHETGTDRPWLRVDIKLRASLPMDAPMPMPHRRIWERWLKEVSKKVEPLLSVDTSPEEWDFPSFWCGRPLGSFEMANAGEPMLTDVSMKSWQGLFLPRVRDDPERVRDPEPTKQVVELAARLGRTLRGWMACAKILRIGDL